MKNYSLVIIGGGPAGVMAALTAAESIPAETILIIEHGPRILRKVLETGNGRCNYTNTGLSAESYNSPEFVSPALSAFGYEELTAYLRRAGIEPKPEPDGRVVPLSEQAASVVDALMYMLHRERVHIMTDTEVLTIRRSGEGFTLAVKGEREATINTEKLILACGGKAKPASGSDGSGYALAEQLGHHCTRLHPGLVQLKADFPYLASLNGVRKEMEVRIISGRRVLGKRTGDLLFTDDGISGPPVFELSRIASPMLDNGEELYAVLNLLGDKSHDYAMEALNCRAEAMPERELSEVLIGLVHKKLIIPVLKYGGYDIHTPIGELNADLLRRLALLLTAMRIRLTGSRSWSYSQITLGGISLSEIDPTTMESRLCHGLYIVGELADIDGACGGFNLHWAFASGRLAGKSAI